MANRVIGHYYSEQSTPMVVNRPDKPPEPDKTKTIAEMSMQELYRMADRLRTEGELEDLIKRLRRNAGEQDSYDHQLVVNTTTPIDEMYHYGIPGQKWGVRRFQNEDGTRTREGKLREAAASQSEDYKSSVASKKKGSQGLSNEELRKLNERLQLEETYKRLTKDDVQRGESWVKRALKNGSEQALSEFTKSALLGSAKILVKNASPEFANAAFNIKEKKKE